MKRHGVALFGVFLLVCGSVLGGALSAGFTTYGIYAPDTIQAYRAVSLQNDFNRYVLKFVETKPRGNRPEEFQIRLREPTTFYSFSRPLYSFMQMRIDDVRLQDVVPDLAKLETWEDEKTAGVSLPLNFNGKRMRLTFLLKGDSPILWCRLQRAGSFSSLVEVTLQMVISGLIVNQFTGYDRLAQSASRTFTARQKPYALAPDDHFLILHDGKIMPGTTYDKSVGPCFVCWDHGPLATATLGLGASYVNHLTFAIRQDAQDFEWGIWEGKRQRTLEEFNRYFAPFLKTLGKR